MKKIICYFFGHKWIPYKGDFMDPYCIRCGKHPTFIQIIRDAFRK